MGLPSIHPLLMDQMIVIISASFMDCFSADEQDVIGNFFSALGSVISFNSSYLSYMQTSLDNQSDSSDQDKEKDYDLILKTVDKLQEEVKKIKQSKH